jgi:putative transposase
MERLHAYLYNAAVANRKTQYKHFKKSVGYYEQQNCLPEFKEVWTEYKQLGSHALQATLKRVDMAFVRFFKGLGGYPKFKPIRFYSGWTYPCISGWKALTNGNNGHLELSNLGKIQMRGTARTWGKPTTCTIVYRQGIWYASITVQCNPARITGTGAVGLDFGCLSAVAMSDATVIENPRYSAKTRAKINKACIAKRRKTKPDLRKRLKPLTDGKKLIKSSKAATQSCTSTSKWVHQTAAHIVGCNSLVATEKLNIKGMTRRANKGSNKKAQKTGLNRSILDVGMGMLRACN